VQGRVRAVRPVLAPDNVFEHENNDGWQYADDMNGQVATGSCAGTNDVDSWRFVSTGAFYSFEVQPAGVTPITDSWLVLRNQKGDPVAADDNGAGLLSHIDIYLPAGTYYLDVSGYNGTFGGDYNLVAQSDPAAITPIGPGGAVGTTQIPLGGLPHNVFQFTVPEGRVNMVVASAGHDTAMVVQRADGMICFSDDDSTAGVLDAAADIDLPAGTYYAYVWDVLGAAGVPFSVSFSNTAGTLPNLLSGVMTKTLAGDESMRVGRVHLTVPRKVTMLTDDGPLAPVGDTVLSLLDRDLDYLCDVDDDDSFNPLRGFYSKISMSLPVGDYLAAVTPFIGSFGDFTLTTSQSAFGLTGTAGFGTTAATIPGFGNVATYALSNCTQASIRVTGGDFWFGILGADGELASCTRCAPWQPQAGELPAGQNTLFVWDRFDFTGPLAATVRPPLTIEGTSVIGRGKHGDDIWLFANFSPLTAGFNFGVGDRGLICLALDPLLMTVTDRVLNATGETVWGTLPPGITGVWLQQGDLHLGVFAPPPALATWRNAVNF
jgi:hypothetical protein